MIKKFYKPLIHSISQRGISINKASAIFAEVSLNPQTLTETELKKVYLQLAKKYHPDASPEGNNQKFIEIREAFERLQAHKEGFTLSEEELFEMYNQTKEGEEVKQNSEMMQEEVKRQFEQWKQSTFTQYNKQAHDQFLAKRYYRYGRQSTTEDHFAQKNQYQNNQKMYTVNQSFQQGSKRLSPSEFYKMRSQSQEITNQWRIIIIVIITASINIWLWNFMIQRKQRARQVQMSTFYLQKEKVFIDENLINQMGIGLIELEQMVANQPDKYVLSTNLKLLLSQSQEKLTKPQ